MTETIRPRSIRRRALVALAALALAAGCDDPFDIEAQFQNTTLAVDVWALNGTPDEFPSALGLPSANLTRPDANGFFEIAFDIDEDGRLLVLPMRLVVNPLGGPRTVNLMPVTAAYAQVTEAPTGGWTNDSTIAVVQGDVFLVRVLAPQCALQLRQTIHAKFRVDTIMVDQRRAQLTGRLNPNCGFRSFGDGIPDF